MGAFQRDGHHTVTPRIFTDDVAGLVAFLRKVFAAKGRVRASAPSEIMIGDSMVMVADGGGLRRRTSAFLYVYVPNADATYKRAVAAGATTIEAPIDMPYGDRRATVRDRWGNTWQIATCRRN